MLARIHQATGGTIPLVGIGGIDTPQRALAKIEAGASLIQLYTGLIYEGPGLIRAIKEELDRAVAANRCDTLAGLVGRRAQEWAARPFMG
jgi:dihydroorotate dehydrogenase